MKINSDSKLEKQEVVDKLRRLITQMIGATLSDNENSEIRNFIKAKETMAELENLMLRPIDHLGTPTSKIHPDGRKIIAPVGDTQQNGGEHQFIDDVD